MSEPLADLMFPSTYGVFLLAENSQVELNDCRYLCDVSCDELHHKENFTFSTDLHVATTFRGILFIRLFLGWKRINISMLIIIQYKDVISWPYCVAWILSLETRESLYLFFFF